MGVIHVFEIVQLVQNCSMHDISFLIDVFNSNLFWEKMHLYKAIFEKIKSLCIN